MAVVLVGIVSKALTPPGVLGRVLHFLQALALLAWHITVFLWGGGSDLGHPLVDSRESLWLSCPSCPQPLRSSPGCKSHLQLRAGGRDPGDGREWSFGVSERREELMGMNRGMDDSESHSCHLGSHN